MILTLFIYFCWVTTVFIGYVYVTYMYVMSAYYSTTLIYTNKIGFSSKRHALLFNTTKHMLYVQTM